MMKRSERASQPASRLSETLWYQVYLWLALSFPQVDAASAGCKGFCYAKAFQKEKKRVIHYYVHVHAQNNTSNSYTVQFYLK